MSVDTLISQSVGHLMQQYDTHTARRPLVGRHREVGD